MLSVIKQAVRNFHHDEEGLEALQVVMIIAMAAMVMIACATLGKEAAGWMKEKWQKLQAAQIT